jgi:Domain of unknown function (DUF3885)
LEQAGKNPPEDRFDLTGYLHEKFPSLRLEGALFYRWPFGIRFEIGLATVPERPAALFEAAFAEEDRCVLIEQDWPVLDLSEQSSSQFFSLFTLPGVFPANQATSPQESEMRVEGEQNDGLRIFTVRWLELPARSFQYAQIFQAIANADNAIAPSLSSLVFFLNRRTDTIFHMYDDRGLDIIAARREPLVSLYHRFSDWVLEYDRERILTELGLRD